ncbi:MAG: zinc ribbon domain-containing protein [Acidobacteriaceae bacterium]|jgi:putative FmdB family regulatory protein|nr:zinc ribbon domain-containing protein [Acidobacteriaceae bacterium]
MPLYEYQCEACGHRFEVIQKFSDARIETCPKCGGHVQKLIASPAIQFKGSGWYITDYAKKSGSDAGRSSDVVKSESSSTGSTDTPASKATSAETKPSDTKPSTT